MFYVDAVVRKILDNVRNINVHIDSWLEKSLTH